MKQLLHFPRTRLSEGAREFGGVTREEAIKGALDQMESMRGDADLMIEKSIATLEQIAAAPQDGGFFSPGQMSAMLARCDQIVTLAGTFGYRALDAATCCLCDLLEGLRQSGLKDIASIRVHVRTMRLLAPGAPPLAAGHQNKVLAELTKILAHHGFARASDMADKAGTAS